MPAFSLSHSIEDVVTPACAQITPRHSDLARSSAPPPALLCPCMVPWAPSNNGLQPPSGCCPARRPSRLLYPELNGVTPAATRLFANREQPARRIVPCT